ncbi:MAG: CDP-glycerol glycerophosphotransferase family protein [Sphaerochaetaceae bacterium]|nr:CDP-glycerol glycerophosphotransferase family protein [Sphaerochaetaceae bacterium]
MSIKESVKNITKKISVPLRKVILLESNPELTGNTFAVYQEMIKRGINKKYKIIWRVSDQNKYKDYPEKNVFFCDYEPKGFLKKLRWSLCKLTSKALIFENRFFYKTWRNQFTFNLTHGMPLKDSKDYEAGDTCDYLLSSGSALDDINSEDSGVPRERIISLGYPRADVLGHRSGANRILNIDGYKKVIVWMPTFRNHELGVHSDGKQYPSGVPFVESDENYKKICDALKKSETCLLVKLHPVQNSEKLLENKDCPNLIFMKDSDLIKTGVGVYELLADSDALLTDYSSVYYDYLLTGHQIGLVIEDIEEYRANRGFAVDYESTIKGTYIRTIDELIKFIEDVATDNDVSFKEREWARLKWCDYRDFKSTERVTDFIMEHLE